MSTTAPTGRRKPDKARLRVDARARRAALPGVDRARWSASVAAELAARLPASGAVMSYMAIGDELDLGSLNAALAGEGRLVLPRVDGRRLASVPWNGVDPLQTSRFGVAEPIGDEIDPQGLVAVVVPGLAFDARGHRVGYGAGFYDRFLPILAPECLVVGVCFSAQLVDDIGPEPHDVAIPIVLTERSESRPHAEEGPR